MLNIASASFRGSRKFYKLPDSLTHNKTLSSYSKLDSFPYEQTSVSRHSNADKTIFINFSIRNLKGQGRILKIDTTRVESG